MCEQLTPDELSFAHEVLVEADHTAACHVKQQVTKIEAALLLRENSANSTRSCCGAWEQGIVQLIVRESALGALKDYAALVLAVLMIVTVYRLPPFVSEICSRAWGGKRVTRLWLFWCIQRQLLRVASDIWTVLKTVFISLLVLVTLVRGTELCAGLVANCTSLKGMHDIALHNLHKVWGSLHELFMLVTAWKTYRLLLQAVVFVAFLPAATLHLLIIVLIRRNPQAPAPHSDPELAESNTAACNQADETENPPSVGWTVAVSIVLWIGIVAYCLLPSFNL